jgi:hypothetical protein
MVLERFCVERVTGSWSLGRVQSLQLPVRKQRRIPHAAITNQESERTVTEDPPLHEPTPQGWGTRHPGHTFKRWFGEIVEVEVLRTSSSDVLRMTTLEKALGTPFERMAFPAEARGRLPLRFLITDR